MDRCLVFTLILAIVGVLFVITGISMQFITNWQVKSRVADGLILQEGSASFENWLSPPVPVYMQFWMWNVTNPDKVVAGTEKAKLVQMGPYTYREVINKSNVEFQDGGKFLRYKQKKWFVFESSMSNGTEQDIFTGVNLPMLAIANSVKYLLSPGTQYMAGASLSFAGVTLFQKLTVKEFLWGYEDPFLRTAKSVIKSFGYNTTAQRIPDVVGLFVGDRGNGSDGGWWTIHTGRDDINQINTIQSWNGITEVDYWNDDYANMINGTDASSWHPFIKRSERLPIFSSDICRSVDLVYQRDVDIKGLNMYRFIVDPMAMASNETAPVNNAFCTPPGNCLLDGVLNVSSCMQGAPIILSLPHFNGADPSYINAIEGMQPTDDMETILDVHPMMGTVMHAARRMQFNAFIEPNPILSDTLDMNATILPIMWVNETAILSNETAQMLITKLHLPLKIVNIASVVMAISGLVLVLSITCYTLCKFIRAHMTGHKKMKGHSGSSALFDVENVEKMLREDTVASQLSQQSKASTRPLLSPV